MNRRDDIGIDVAHRRDHADRKTTTKKAHRGPVRVSVDGEAPEDLIPHDDDARLRHAFHNGRECPDPPTNAARALRLSAGASFPWEKASRSRSWKSRRLLDGKPGVKPSLMSLTPRPACRPAS